MPDERSSGDAGTGGTPMTGPIRRAAFAASAPDRAETLIKHLYVDNRVRIDDPGDAFNFGLVSAAAGPLGFNRGHWGFTGHIRMEPLPMFSAMVALAGSLTVGRPGRHDHAFTAGGVWIAEPGEPMEFSFRPGVYAGLTLPMSVIDEAAGARSPSDATAVRFLGTVPVDAAAGHYWSQLMRLVNHQTSTVASPLDSVLVRDHLVGSLARAALITFPNTVMTTAYVAPPAGIGPASLHRAVDYMHAHAAEPITVAQVADVAGISIRALQQAFIRHHGRTPTAYLRHLRLERAHLDLRAADPAYGDSVTAIARRWGFAHLSKFSAAYRDRYGVSPSITLRTTPNRHRRP
ncbi:AraC family transcriptional regulator [Actinoplanes sp. NPDC048988]|uniref:helix-turn-helix transcriptional regulator n=1 Tax=Actinoplanes sp. NPDC048988 TaxID=3363901 RepID=UPI0037214F7B